MKTINKRFLICNGDANSYTTHGGLPYNLFKTAKQYGLISNAISLDYQKLKYWKVLWNFIQFLKYRKPKGFQWSEVYVSKLIKQIKYLEDQELNILSIYPLLPSYPWPKKWNVDFYIDATISQILDEYKLSNQISNSYKREIINRERLNYEKANRIICRSNWAIQSLIKDYKIENSKISLVPGGANLDIKEIDRGKLLSFPPKPSINHPVIVGFIGLDWDRKGGNFLIKLADTFNDNNIPFEIRVVGPKKKTLPNHNCLKYVGFIDKFLNLDLFIKELTSWHFGTLFSKAEAFGISNRECLILGVPVICHDVGGISSTLPKSNFGKMFDANPSPLIVYNWLIDIFSPYEKYISLRKKLLKQYKSFAWDRTINNLKKVL
tara:strand:- start:33 stop:1166 length:1134 start_codon:yes stop_codon:yes gene_type:complete